MDAFFHIKYSDFNRHLQQPYWTNGEKVNTLDLYSNYRGSNPLLSTKFVCLDN